MVTVDVIKVKLNHGGLVLLGIRNPLFIFFRIANPEARSGYFSRYLPWSGSSFHIVFHPSNLGLALWTKPLNE